MDVARFKSQVLRAGSSLEAKCASLLMSLNLSGTERRVSPGALVEMEEYRFKNKNLEGCAFGMARRYRCSRARVSKMKFSKTKNEGLIRYVRMRSRMVV